MKVKLKTKSVGDSKSKNQEFTLDQANKLLKLPNTRWELSDENFNWNGSEIAPNATTSTATTKKAVTEK